MDVSQETVIDAIRVAAKRSEVIAAIESLYRALDAEIIGHAPTCWNKGECCRFGEYGHRLYVTPLEVAYYLAIQAVPETLAAPPSATSLAVLNSGGLSSGDTCPHARGGRCQIRSVRPMGCRIFYCDPAARHWQGPMTEAYLARLRELHDTLGVPYFYADWMKVQEMLEQSENV